MHPAIIPHHIGYAVRDHDQSAAAFTALGYRVEREKTLDTGRNLWISFWRNDAWLVELLATADADKPSPIDSVLKGAARATPYHICYQCPSLDGAIEALSKCGYRLIQKPAPAPAIDGCPVAFMFHAQMGIIELVEIA